MENLKERDTPLDSNEEKSPKLLGIVALQGAAKVIKNYLHSHYCSTESVIIIDIA